MEKKIDYKAIYERRKKISSKLSEDMNGIAKMIIWLVYLSFFYALVYMAQFALNSFLFIKNVPIITGIWINAGVLIMCFGIAIGFTYAMLGNHKK